MVVIAVSSERGRMFERLVLFFQGAQGAKGTQGQPGVRGHKVSAIKL